MGFSKVKHFLLEFFLGGALEGNIWVNWLELGAVGGGAVVLLGIAQLEIVFSHFVNLLLFVR